MVRHQGLLLIAVMIVALAATSCQGGGQSGDAGGSDLAAAQSGRGQAVAADGVTVTGVGRTSGTPDTLRATLGVEVTRGEVDQAFNDANAAADRVLTALRDQGVAEEDIQTREFSVRPEREHPPEEPEREGPPGEPRVTGYTVRNLVEATVRDVDAAGGDAVRIRHMEFSLEDNAAQLESARKAAFEDAKAKAEHYASLSGRELGQLVSVDERGADEPSPVSVDEEQARAPAPPIRPGEQEVNVRVQARWTLD